MTGRYPDVAVKEVHSTAENPFKATLVTEDGYFHGKVRIEPPIIEGNELLDRKADFGVRFTHDFTTEHATVLGFEVGEDGLNESGDVRGINGQPLPVFVTREILNELGQAANRQLFVKHYQEKMD